MWTGFVTSNKGRTGTVVIWGDKRPRFPVLPRKRSNDRDLLATIRRLKEENEELRTMNQYLREHCKSLADQLRKTKVAGKG